MDASPPLVGRGPEREAIGDVLARVLAGAHGAVVAIEGEPGIGKSRLLAHLDARAAAGGCTVLTARASEYEADLPYASWTQALDPHLAARGERAVGRLGLTDAAGLAGVLPTLTPGAEPAGRHRVTRALRDLLERLAATRPLVLCLDDVHWMDPESAGALAGLLHRPPAAPVLLALAARPGQLPAPVAAGLAVALREGRATQIVPAPLSEAEATELVGPAAATLYAASGGNPFYLEQLARGGSAAGAGASGDGTIPPAVAAALATEVAALPGPARALLEGAAVAGDPFDLSLATTIAGDERSEGGAAALDLLVATALVRPAGAPLRFAFRHPVVRHAVYAALPAGRRIAMHRRAAAALAARGAAPAERAHHVEQSAAPGDVAAIALLRDAATALQPSAPATAARHLAGALRLLPTDAPDRTALQSALADAQAAAGDPAAARATLLTALETAPPAHRLALTVATANAEWGLGFEDDARRRLQVALADLPAQPSRDRIRLRLALALTALSSGALDDAAASAADARADAETLGEPLFAVAARSCGAVALACLGRGTADLAGTEAALEALSGDERAMRLPAAWMLARARRATGALVASLAHLERAQAIAARTGREAMHLLLLLESVPVLIELGRIPEALAAAEDGVDRARVAGHVESPAWALAARARARLAAGDVTGALRDADEARSPRAIRFRAPGEPAWVRGVALVAAGEPARGADALAGVADAVPPVERSRALADLALAHLTAGDEAAARSIVTRASAVPGAPELGLARSAVALAAGDAAAALAAAEAALADSGERALLRARARLAVGCALVAAGDRTAARAALTEAERELGGFGALRDRDAATRALRELGHRVVRPRAGDGALGPLTAREREIAELVAAGRTNREIAAQLVLSARTIDAHLRNVFAKLGVRSRVELTRKVSRS